MSVTDARQGRQVAIRHFLDWYVVEEGQPGALEAEHKEFAVKVYPAPDDDIYPWRWSAETPAGGGRSGNAKSQGEAMNYACRYLGIVPWEWSRETGRGREIGRRGR